MYVCLAPVTDRNYKFLDSEDDFVRPWRRKVI